MLATPSAGPAARHWEIPQVLRPSSSSPTHILQLTSASLGNTGNAGKTLSNTTTGLGQTVGDTTTALGSGDLTGTAAGATNGVGSTVGGAGQGLGDTVEVSQSPPHQQPLEHTTPSLHSGQGKGCRSLTADACVNGK